ncbi:MAG: (Fe-S)-binding protein, partial [Deltaproteobacteria bacterium]|nr:(Fe-S)-binding protein [Deltaproteobacteria bacterium]
VITSLPNVFLRNLKPYGALRTINLEDPNITSFGVEKLTDFSWKDILDVYSCTECGRCTAQCPAWNTGKPLNPKEINIFLKDYMYENIEKLTNGKQEVRDEAMIPLVPDVIHSDMLWSCTTCRACEEACPVMIDFVDRIVDMRRNLVLMKGEFPEEAQVSMRNIENNGNPWGIGYDERATWAKDLNVPSLAEKNEVEVLYWVGCAGSFDDRNKKVSTAIVKILQEAKVDFAILGPEETCTGDPARRIGNEYLFQTLAQQNIGTMGKYKFKKVLAQCPHCFNTIKNEYPQFGGNFEVVHHTDYIAELIQQGRVKSSKNVNEKITYHDSCYLGRYNKIYDAPREILKSIPGVQYADAEISKETGRCCGAGGGRMWMEERLGGRVNHKRLEDLQTVSPQTVASACPFCKVMITDATRDKHVELPVKDVAEIFAETL